MSLQKSPRDPWRWPALLLWLLFFTFGLWPALTFSLLRTAGYVFSQNAIINSYNFITWSLTGFVGYFVYQRCLEARLPSIEALGKSIQLGVLAFIAFIDLPIEHIPDIRFAGDRALVLGTVALKILVWLYLYSLIARYHWTRNPRKIAGALPYFALSHAPDPPAPDGEEEQGPGDSENRSSVENPAD